MSKHRNLEGQQNAHYDKFRSLEMTFDTCQAGRQALFIIHTGNWKTQMTIGRIFIIILLLSFSLASTPVLANSEQGAWHQEATSNYDNGDYASAYKKYLKLAKKGDWFSQYRISYMELNGLGTSEDVIESLAWAVLAAQNGPEDLASYQDVVAALVPEDKRKKAQQKVDYYMRRWGEDDDNDTRISSGKCTGSRLACSPAPSAHNWISWKRNEPQGQELEDLIETLNQSILESPGAG